MAFVMSLCLLAFLSYGKTLEKADSIDCCCFAGILLVVFDDELALLVYGTSLALPFDNLSGIGTVICVLFGNLVTQALG